MAALLARTGQVEEALTIVKAIRERHDGFKRNPFSENEKVRKEVYEMMNWWVKKGVDGFRMDVINFISKVPGLPESADVEVGYGEYGKWSVSPWKLTELKGIFGKWQNELNEEGWNSLYWSNHDQPRAVSRFGDDREEYREGSAKMLAVCLHMMKATPFIYHGEELGMTNTRFTSIQEHRDIEILTGYIEYCKTGLSSPDRDCTF